MEGAFPRGRGAEDDAPKAATKRASSAGPHAGRLFGAKKAAPEKKGDGKRGGGGDGKKARSSSAKPAARGAKDAAAVVPDASSPHAKSRADELTFKVRPPPAADVGRGGASSTQGRRAQRAAAHTPAGGPPGACIAPPHPQLSPRPHSAVTPPTHPLHCSACARAPPCCAACAA